MNHVLGKNGHCLYCGDDRNNKGPSHMDTCPGDFLSNKTVLEDILKRHVDKFASEQESLVAKFIKEKNCLPSEIVVVSHMVGTAIVVSVELKKDFEERQHGGDRRFRRGF